LQNGAKATEDGKNLEHHRRILRCMGNGMQRKYDLELERPYPARETVKRRHISRDVKLYFCWEGVRGVHSTDENADNKTAQREGALLHSSFWRG